MADWISPFPRASSGPAGIQASTAGRVSTTCMVAVQAMAVPAGQGVVVGNDIPYLPAALAKKRENFAARATADPESKGFLPGVPRIMYMPFPFQIFQTPDHIVMVFEYDRGVRTVFTNGTPHPRGPINFWMGDSRGRWEGTTLIVETANMKGTRLSMSGDFFSDNVQIVERIAFVDADTMNYEATVTDPTVFTRPWTMRVVEKRRPDEEPLESACWERNPDPDTWLNAPATGR